MHYVILAVALAAFGGVVYWLMNRQRPAPTVTPVKKPPSNNL